MFEEWKPDTRDPERSARISEHLRDVLASDAFKGGKRAQDFLQLVVEHALAGREDNLRERMLGAEMFGRPIDYDTSNDAVVRVKATEVRRRLAQYYLGQKESSGVQIELRAGSYVPQFFFEAGLQAEAAATSALAEPSGQPEEPPEEKPEETPTTASTAGTRTWLRVWLGSWPARILLGIGIAILTVAVLFIVERSRQAVAAQPIRSIAILPLANFSGDPSQDYFADGMTEELTAELGQVNSLRVISRTSTMTYKGTKKTLPEIARELNVDGMIEGSIDREGNRVRITVQLIDSKTDQHIWAHTYDRDMTSVLQMQSDVARAIADQVQIELTPQVLAHFNRTQTVDPQAVELFLQAAQRLDRGNPKAAIDLLRQAIEKDPNYAPAHASLADAYGWMGEAGWMSYKEAFSLQKAEALKAIALDDSRPEPHLNLGIAAMNQSWDWATQSREFQRALQLNPNAANVHWAYANYLSRYGQPDQAVAEAKLALQLDPVSSRSFTNTAFVHYYARRYDQALVDMQQSAALHADSMEVLFPLGVIYVEKGLYDQGIEEFKKLGDVPHALGHMGNAYARQGRTAEARALLPKVEKHIEKSGVGRYEIALIYAGLKDNDNAFAWLEKAYDAHDKGLTYLKIDPGLDPLRSDPRFGSLMKRVGLPL